jgi:hypothetical protein
MIDINKVEKFPCYISSRDDYRFSKFDKIDDKLVCTSICNNQIQFEYNVPDNTYNEYTAKFITKKQWLQIVRLLKQQMKKYL